MDTPAAWTAPRDGSYHFNPAPDAPPHHAEDCTEQCRQPDRHGWFAWVAKGRTIDPNDDPAWRPGG